MAWPLAWSVAVIAIVAETTVSKLKDAAGPLASTRRGSNKLLLLASVDKVKVHDCRNAQP